MAKILVVENDADARDLLRILLQTDGHEIVEATTADDGIAQAERQKPDLILMDVSLAGPFDGLEATRRLRSDSNFDAVPIIALTAHAMAGDRQRALDAGCDDYWTKPITDLLSFKDAVASAVSNGRRCL